MRRFDVGLTMLIVRELHGLMTLWHQFTGRLALALLGRIGLEGLLLKVEPSSDDGAY